MKSTCEDDDNDDLTLIIRGSVVSLDFFFDDASGYYKWLLQ